MMEDDPREEIPMQDNIDGESSSDGDEDDDTEDEEIVQEEGKKSRNNKAGFEEVPMQDLDCVGKAIGAAMVSSRKRKRDIIDSGYHRFMFDDEGLPDWFIKDESKHTKREMPVTKGEIQEYKMKERDINARPIKKIAESKARKKKKEMRKLERVRKKADTISENVDITDRDKWQQIKQVYKKAGLLSKKKKEVTYVMAKKGAGKKVSRPSGVQGPFKVVDRRMKKDNKFQKSQQKSQKGKGKKGKQRGNRK